jgi:hypothetical protein
MNPQAAAASITANNATAGAMFPPANFALWPLTRVSALVYLALLPIICAIPVVRRCCLRNNKASRWGWPILIGLLFSLWLHFIPCIFWTCDWGPYDGAGVRREEEEPVVWCVLWCVVWRVVWRVLCVLRTRPHTYRYISLLLSQVRGGIWFIVWGLWVGISYCLNCKTPQEKAGV